VIVFVNICNKYLHLTALTCGCHSDSITRMLGYVRWLLLYCDSNAVYIQSKMYYHKTEGITIQSIYFKFRIFSVSGDLFIYNVIPLITVVNKNVDI
jgi:hypothetical protein